MADKKTTQEPPEKILYIYRCPKCNKFEESNCRNDSLICSCGEQMIMSTPEHTIEHYKKSRKLYNAMTIIFTILLPIFTLCMFMFVKETDTDAASLGYKLPILGLVLIGAILMKGRVLLDKAIANTDNAIVRGVIVFFSKNTLYLVVIGILAIILAFIQNIGDSLLDIIIALAIVVVENTIGYCVFDYRYQTADYIIKKALRQSETIQAMEMSGR